LHERRFADAGITDGGDGVTLRDNRVFLDRDRAQMRQRHRPPVGGLDRHRPAAAGHRAGERDDARLGCTHPITRAPRQIDAPMLTGGIRACRIE
jgi:hypothetical protein